MRPQCPGLGLDPKMSPFSSFSLLMLSITNLANQALIPNSYADNVDLETLGQSNFTTARLLLPNGNSTSIYNSTLDASLPPDSHNSSSLEANPIPPNPCYWSERPYAMMFRRRRLFPEKEPNKFNSQRVKSFLRNELRPQLERKMAAEGATPDTLVPDRIFGWDSNHHQLFWVVRQNDIETPLVPPLNYSMVQGAVKGFASLVEDYGSHKVHATSFRLAVAGGTTVSWQFPDAVGDFDQRGSRTASEPSSDS